jgi:hypothetical protein
MWTASTVNKQKNKMKKTKKQIMNGIIFLVAIALFSISASAYIISPPVCCCSSSEVFVVDESDAYDRCVNSYGQSAIVSGAAGSYSQCLQTCNSNVCTTCRAGTCSDWQDCRDNPDTGICNTGESCCLGACTMKQGPGQGCESPTLAIRPNNLARGNNQGYKQVSLSWGNNYDCPAISYDVLRCLGEVCTPTALVTTTSQNSYNDAAVEWGSTYRYMIKGNYPYQGQKSSDILTVYVGDSECQGHTTSAGFCLGNDQASCNIYNSLTRTKCPQDKMCVGGQCISSSDCNSNLGNPFGEYYTAENCEGTSQSYKYCFLDRSKTNVDMCYTCGGNSMKCYDYKSERACLKDNCKAGTMQNPTSCEWHPISYELGIGVCVDREADNCGYCKMKGTSGMANVNQYAYNDVFDIYTSARLNALSTRKYPCFEVGNNCVSCGDSGCSLYKTANTCSKLTTPVSLNGLNELMSSSQDSCGINVCRWFSNTNSCRKDADGVALADCEGFLNATQCERDYFKPNATIAVLKDSEESTNGFSFTITDKTNINEIPAVKTSSDYKIYYCVVGNGSSCIPRTPNHGFKYTSLRILSIGNSGGVLKLCTGPCGNSSIILKNGNNTIKYYAEDPSKNIGLVQSQSFFASTDTRPVPYAYYIQNYHYFANGSYYTNNKKPIIQINFSFASKLLDFELKDSSGRTINLSYTDNGYKETHSIQTNSLTDGTYTFTFNAESQTQRQMVSKKQFTFIVDTQKPTITITPSGVITQKDINFDINFNEKSLLDNASVNGQDVTNAFSTSNSLLYKALLKNFSEGIYTLYAEGSDYAGNIVTGSSSFEVNSIQNLAIWMIVPRYGVSPNKTFTLTMGTDNTADCRYRLNEDGIFDASTPFKELGSTIHTKLLNNIQEGVEQTLYVKCRDRYYDKITNKTFKIEVDTTAPVIKAEIKEPQPIAAYPPFATLKVNTSDLTICNYTFPFAEDSFYGFETLTFARSHSETLYNIPGNKIIYPFEVTCMNRAELISSVNGTLSIDNTADMVIADRTKDYFTNKTALLDIDVNIDTSCRYSSDKDVPTNSWPSMIKNTTSVHIAYVNVPGNGNYKYYVKCFDNRNNTYLPEPAFEISFDVDTTPPNMSYVNDSSDENNPEFTWRNDRLRVKFLGYDNETSVSQYYYRLKKFNSETSIIVNWTLSTERSGDWIWVYEQNPDKENSLNLSDKQKYQFEVKPENEYGLIGKSMLSDGIIVDNSTKSNNCSNGIKDNKETDIDCGDGCDSCGINKTCNVTSDCQFNLVCSNKKCRNQTNETIREICSDNTKNGQESDIDCGGNCSNKCDNGKLCSNKDSNCKSGYCDISTGKCALPDVCHNNQIDPGETGIDCGGQCDACGAEDFCSANRDCGAGLICFQGIGICKEDADGDGTIDSEDNCPDVESSDQTDQDEDGKGDLCDDDIDGDGLYNEFENRYGLDQYNIDSDENGITDDQEDPDGEGLTNLDEQNNGPGYCLDPFNKDSDGDGIDDKTEVDKGTDPCDANSKPKSLWWLWLLLLLLLILILLGLYLGYPKYKEYIEKKSTKKIIRPTIMPQQGLPRKPVQEQKPMVQPPRDSKLDELIDRKRREKDQQRKGLFSAFGGSVQEQKAPQKEKIREKEETQFKKDEPKKEAPKENEEWLHVSSLPKPQKKDDIFGKLKSISKDQKDIFKKLNQVSKQKEAPKETKIVPIIVQKSPEEKALKVVSTKTSKIYHKPGCITIKGKKNLVTYNTEQQAKNKNMKRCDVCFPVKK